MGFITVQKEAGVAVVTMAKEPVNSMDLLFWRELLEVVKALDADKEVRGMIFQSGLKKSVFTAGLDVKELYAPATTQERLMEFWETLSTVLTKIYSTSKVTAAAIRGACPAGGCCLALCCDYRVITSDGSMGLNEVVLGIPVPKYWVDLFASITGHRQAELLLQSGDMAPSAKLQQLGMVDAVVDKSENPFPKALEEVRRWLKSPDAGRVATKRVLRGALADGWVAGMNDEAKEVWRSCSDPKTVASLGKVLERLSGGKAPPASKL